MHHPKEAIIDGVKFVLVREELLEKLEKFLMDIYDNSHVDYTDARLLINQLRQL